MTIARDMKVLRVLLPKEMAEAFRQKLKKTHYTYTSEFVREKIREFLNEGEGGGP